MKGGIFCALLVFVGLTDRTQAGCCLPETAAKQFDDSRAVVKAEVISAEPFFTATGGIRTRHTLRVAEKFKGDTPATFELVSDGGQIGDRASSSSGSLGLKAGESYILLLTRQPDGSWTSAPHRAFHAPANRPEITKFFRSRARGKRPPLVTASTSESAITRLTGFGAGVPGSVVTPTGYLEDTNGLPYRSTTCDTGESIPYLVDIDPTKLPTGMDQTAALAAVREAFDAWTAASSLTFRFAGLQSFGDSSGNISTADGIIRIQLHDNYNFLTVPVLGHGGSTAGRSLNTMLFGGNVATQGFQELMNGYVVMNHRQSFPSAAFYKQVLTHEIGHALGLAHSSENPSEPEPILKNATMYYAAANDNRGAAITVYDQDRIAFGYPSDNVPPHAIDRIIPAVTASNVNLLPATPGCNQIRLSGMDREGAPLSAWITSSTSTNGTFSLSGTTLTYRPSVNGNVSLTAAQIAAGSYYDQAIVQLGDGIHRSNSIVCTVVSFSSDSTPSDGLPDSWMTAHFGSTATGALASGRHPDDDPDKDGLTNRIEFYLGTNPNSAASGSPAATYLHANRQLSFTPLRFAPYRVEASTTLASGSWTTRRVVTRYDSTTGALTPGVSSTSTPTKEFYRVVTGP